MKLVIHRPTVIVQGAKLRLEVVRGSKVEIWTAKTKGVNNKVLNAFKVKEFAVEDIPAQGLTLWVEAGAASKELRDIELRLRYMGGSDTVNATAVWSQVDDKRGMKHTAGDVMWGDAGAVGQAYLAAVGGFGLRAVTNNGGTGTAQNGIGTQFVVGPHGINAEPVFFDITRQKDWKEWSRRTGEAWAAGERFAFPLTADLPNDDGGENDESSAPNVNDHMYSFDAPLVQVIGTGTIVEAAARSNFAEFMRVRFDEAPAGDTVSGSRASSFQLWHVRFKIEKVGGLWRRTTGDAQESEENDINPGWLTVVDTGNSP